MSQLSGKRVLITGASGLLGRECKAAFSADSEWTVLGLAYSRAKDGLCKVDLTDENQLSAVIREFQPTVIVHSAAERRPDIVETEPEKTKNLNVLVTQRICDLAKEVGAYVIYISTDYVFDGTKAPYQETDPVNPLNKYGISKAEGEKVTLDASPDNILLRIPVLYGEVEKLDESAVTVLYQKVRVVDKPAEMNHYERRYPTHVADVAQAVKLIANSKQKDPSVKGPFHFSGSEMMTKYDMAVVMADVKGLPTDHIVADTKPSTGASRPYDCHLNSPKLDALGTVKRTPFKEGIKQVLSRF